jgi:hypothetical protein
VAGRHGDSARRFLISVSVVPLVLLPLALSAFQPRYLGWFHPEMFVIVGAGLIGALPPRPDDGAEPPERWRVRLRPWVVVTAVLMTFDVALLVGAQSYLWRTGATNAKFFELRDALRARGGCSAGVVVEDFGDESTPDSDRTWIFFNQASIVYTLALDRCPTTEVPVRSLADPAQRQRLRGWAIVSEPVAAALQEEQRAERLMSIDPGSTGGTNVAYRFRFVLLRVGEAPSDPRRILPP